MGLGAAAVVTIAAPVSAPGLHFSAMRAEDLDAVMEVERCCFAEPWSPGLFLHELKIPFSRLVLARRGHATGELVGYVCRWLVGDEVHILNIAVRPEWRRRGIGRALVELVLREAVETKVRMVTLEVRRGNAEAIGLYGSLGFVETGVRRNYYGRGHDALIMTRTFAAAGVGDSAAGPGLVEGAGGKVIHEEHKL